MRKCRFWNLEICLTLISRSYRLPSHWSGFVFYLQICNSRYIYSGTLWTDTPCCLSHAFSLRSLVLLMAIDSPAWRLTILIRVIKHLVCISWNWSLDIVWSVSGNEKIVIKLVLYFHLLFIKSYEYADKHTMEH